MQISYKDSVICNDGEKVLVMAFKDGRLESMGGVCKARHFKRGV